MSRRRLVIAGDSSFAEVACNLFDAQGHFEVCAFAVHTAYRKRDTLLGRPIHAIEEIDLACPPKEYDVFVALTYRELNRARARICVEMQSKGYELATYVSPNAFVWKNTPIGKNSFIFENNVIQPFCEIGENVILWSGNHIGHHSVVEDNVFLASHIVISGHCRVGSNSFIGVNATVADNVTIAKDNWIGPGSLITKDTEEGEMYRVESTAKSAVGSLRFFRVKSGA